MSNSGITHSRNARIDVYMEGLPHSPIVPPFVRHFSTHGICPWNYLI